MNSYSRHSVRALRAGVLLVALLTLGACKGLSVLNPFKSSPKSEAPAGKTTVEPGAAGGRSTVVSDDTKRVAQFVSQTQFGYVRIERSEDGAPPNDQPFAITATQLRALLEKLQFGTGGDTEAIFNADELAEIAGPLSTALAKASPREDVTFAVSGKHGAVALFQPRTVTTGRLFVKNGSINIIFNDIHGQFEDQFLATGWLRPFVPGSRSNAANVTVVAGPGVTFASNNRHDWIQVAESSLPPAPTARPAAGAVPGAAAGGAPQSDAYYQDIEKRLTLLKGLKDKGLITEEEFNDKRKEILKGL